MKGLRILVLGVIALGVFVLLAGDRRQEPHIIGGFEPDPGEWPWTAAVLRSERVSPGQSDYRRHFCGGTLIAPQLILTAAHCMAGESPSAIQVVLGRQNLNDSSGEKIDAARISVDSQSTSDLAVIRLSRPANEAPARLAAAGARPADNTLLRTMGWGLQKEGDNASKSESLLAANVPIWSAARCKRAERQFDEATMICAASPRAGVDTCEGDSGGPLMATASDGSWRLIGVTSFGDGCARPGKPGFYASVTAPSMRRWVVRHMVQGTKAEPPVIRRLTFRPIVRRSERVTYSLSESAAVSFRVAQVRPGRRAASTLVPGTLRQLGRKGTNRFRLGVRLNGRQLRPGSYRLIAKATDSDGNRSLLKRVRFRVAR